MTTPTHPQPNEAESFEQETRTIVYDVVQRTSDLAEVARKMDKGLLIEPDAFNNHVAAIVAAHTAKTEEAVRLAITEAASDWLAYINHLDREQRAEAADTYWRELWAELNHPSEEQHGE